MRILTTLALVTATLAPAAVGLAQEASHGHDELLRAIRQIVREEVRAALSEAGVQTSRRERSQRRGNALLRQRVEALEQVTRARALQRLADRAAAGIGPRWVRQNPKMGTFPVSSIIEFETDDEEVEVVEEARDPAEGHHTHTEHSEHQKQKLPSGDEKPLVINIPRARPVEAVIVEVEVKDPAGGAISEERARLEKTRAQLRELRDQLQQMEPKAQNVRGAKSNTREELEAMRQSLQDLRDALREFEANNTRRTSTSDSAGSKGEPTPSTRPTRLRRPR